MSRFRLKDQKWREWVDDGTKTMQEYNEWRYGQIAVGQRWEAMKDTIAHDIHNTNMIAKSITQGYMPEVYANNFNYGTYEAEVGSHINTSFTLYDKQTVERIMRDDPDLLPAPGKKTSKRIAEGKDVLWNKKQIQSVMTQGILQGESIPKISKRLATTVGDKNYKAAIRNARTMTTGAQNAGRMDSYKRAESMGIDMEVEWIATLDGRTRHEHRMLDGQMRPVGKPFEVEGVKIQYAGDPHAPGNMIYNCRCTLAGHVKGFDAAEVDRDTSAIGDMTYDEWKKSKDIKSNPIDLQEQNGKAISRKYKEEYRESSSGLKNSSDNGIIKSLDVDDFELMATSSNINKEAVNIIASTVNEYENAGGMYFTDFSFEDNLIDLNSGKSALLQTDVNYYGGTVLRINKTLLSQDLDAINKMIKDTDKNLPNDLREAVIHECGHAKTYYRKKVKDIREMNEKLAKKHISGVSIIAEGDGSECIAEVEVLLSRGSKVPEEAMDLYNEYVNGIVK